MLSNARSATWASAALGVAIGLSMGLASGAFIALLCLVGLSWLLSKAGLPAAVAAHILAAFAVGLMAAGHTGFAFGTPSELRLLAAVPLAALVLANGVCAALLGCAGFALCRSPVARVTLLVPSIWTLQEWLFSLTELAVPWLRLGYSQASGGPLAGAFPLGGVLLVGWSMLSASGATAALMRARGRARLVWTGVLLAGLSAGMVASRVEWTSPAGSLTVDLVQSGVRSQDKFDDAATGRILGLYDSVLRTSRAELVVGSQLAIPKIAAALPEGYLARLHAGLQRRHADALLGIYFSGDGPGQLFNGVVGLGRSGVQQHLKHHVFPFGEAIPLRGRPLEWVQSLLPSPMLATQPGPVSNETLRVGAQRAAVAICFEAAFGDAWRASAATADFLVNVSSDSAVDSRQLSRQFKLIDQARALEFQKPLLRTSDVRGTFFVDAYGQISGELPNGSPGVAQGVVLPRVGLTPYARFGDCLALLLSAFGVCSAWLFTLRRWATTGTAAPPRPRRAAGVAAIQSGQVLPLAAVLMLIVGGLFYLMVNAGQSVTEKMRVTNAADAAAYSAGVVEARALNHDAYINRAMVANQIAIAQMVSFASWVNYFATAADNFGENMEEVNFFLLPNPNVAVLDVMFGGSKIAATYFGGRTVQDYADYIVDGAGVIITVHDIAVTALSSVQKAVHANLTGGVRQGQIADQVAKAMDPALHAEVVRVSHGFDTFTKNYGRSGGPGDERGRFADVTTRSRDPFTRERNWTEEGSDIPFVRQDGALKKRSGTELIGYDEWRAVDTLELHGKRFGCGRFGLDWCSDVRRPIGWGAVEVDAGGGDAGAGYHGNAYGENPTTAAVADWAMTTPPYSHFSGLPDSREVTDLDPAHDISTGITIRVSKAQAATLTSGNAAQAKPAGRMDLFADHPAGGQLAALSRAQVFFDRIAARADGKTEMGSLYNPYWRVRLVAPTAADKAYAATKQEGLALP